MRNERKNYSLRKSGAVVAALGALFSIGGLVHGMQEINASTDKAFNSASSQSLSLEQKNAKSDALVTQSIEGIITGNG